jgi:CheY-like chemotaxis protein
MSRLVIAAVADLFFASKIRATAEPLGVELLFVRNADVLLSTARANKPNLIVVDLQSTNLDPLELAVRVRGDEELREVPLLGFYSHVLVELQEQAREAGYTHLMPRSAFSSNLAGVLSGEG